MPRRENTRGRRPSVRPSLPIVHVICGGERTERDYLDGLKQSVQNKAVHVRLMTKHRAPEQLVAYAIDIRARSLVAIDELWCVVDADHYEVAGARQLAARHGVKLAVSRPCFELWLLLHFEDCTAHLSDYKAAAERLKKHVPRYDKRKLDFGDYSGGVRAAIRRAEKLGDSGNPSTGMWGLAQRICDQEDYQ